MLFLLPFCYSVTSLKQLHPWLHSKKTFCIVQNPSLRESNRTLVFHTCLFLSDPQHKKWIILIVATKNKIPKLVYLKMGENKTGRLKDMSISGTKILMRVWFQSSRNFLVENWSGSCISECTFGLKDLSQKQSFYTEQKNLNTDNQCILII